VLPGESAAEGADAQKLPPCTPQVVRVAAERIKIELSSAKAATFSCNHMIDWVDHTVAVTFTRPELELACKDLLDRTMLPIKDVLSVTKMVPSDIDELVLVGGSSRIPWVRKMLRDYFDKQPNCHIDPDIAVAYGAATVAH